MYFSTNADRSDDEINMLRQISVDCPRTVPDVAFFQQAQVQKSLDVVLYTWAIRHPASGYVQGINDLVTPFLVVFLSEYLDESIDSWSISDLSSVNITNIEANCYWCLSQLLDGMQDHYTFAQPGIQRLVFKLKEFVRRFDGNLSSVNITNIEADCYWCLSQLLDGMQDHYTFAQPGIQRLVFKLKELVRRIDGDLFRGKPVSRHVENQGLEFLQFAFRWFNCLLIREIPFHLVTRQWDAYLAEGDALPDFLKLIDDRFVVQFQWSDTLQNLDFQELVMFLQHLPTHNWTYQELEIVLSRAYMWHDLQVGNLLSEVKAAYPMNAEEADARISLPEEDVTVPPMGDKQRKIVAVKEFELQSDGGFSTERGFPTVGQNSTLVFSFSFDQRKGELPPGNRFCYHKQGIFRILMLRQKPKGF
ncbi:Detected protein of confused Function [Hibiscus syriacus]|uniref:Detected protein of confused Function n=1 Tax=Hibiscus syriacus TaxID=106335 RepID=A0A6A2ZSR0_HIBSY|nr:Detected protein of confused Function [Hibiscus syriacus]